MSLTLTRMRVRVREGLGGLDSDDIDDTNVDELLNISLWELEDKFPFEAKETLFSSTLVTNQYEYGMPPSPILFDAIVSIAVIDSEGQRFKLDRMTRSWLDDNFDDSDLGQPEKYLREGNVLTLFPIPDTDQSGLAFDIMAKESIADISGANPATGLPRNWDEIVVMGAIWRGHFAAQDYDQARESMSLQVSLIRSTVPTVAKEERDSQQAGLSILWDTPL